MIIHHSPIHNHVIMGREGGLILIYSRWTKGLFDIQSSSVGSCFFSSLCLFGMMCVKYLIAICEVSKKN